MARRHQLRVQRTGTVINVTSKMQETGLSEALPLVIEHLGEKFQNRIGLHHETQWHLREIVANLRQTYPESEFHYFNEQGGRLNRGSFYFRPEPWTIAEMVDIMRDIATRSVLYYFSRYREDRFLKKGA